MRPRNAEAALTGLGMPALMASEPYPVLVGQKFDHLEADVVTGGGVLGPGIPEPDDEPGTC